MRGFFIVFVLSICKQTCLVLWKISSVIMCEEGEVVKKQHAKDVQCHFAYASACALFFLSRIFDNEYFLNFCVT